MNHRFLARRDLPEISRASPRDPPQIDHFCGLIRSTGTLPKLLIFRRRRRRGPGGSSPGALNGMWKRLEWQLQRSPNDRKNQRSKGLKLWICSSFCVHGSLPLPFFANTGHRLRRSFRPFTIGNRTEISITVPPS